MVVRSGSTYLGMTLLRGQATGSSSHGGVARNKDVEGYNVCAGGEYVDEED